MTKNEYIDLVEAVHYYHDFEIVYKGRNLFFEFVDLKYEVYDITDFVSNENPAPLVCTVEGFNINNLADRLMNDKIIDGESISDSYQNIELIDIE